MFLMWTCVRTHVFKVSQDVLHWLLQELAVAVQHDMLLTKIWSDSPSICQFYFSSSHVMQTDISSRVSPLKKLKYKKHFIQICSTDLGVGLGWGVLTAYYIIVLHTYSVFQVCFSSIKLEIACIIAVLLHAWCKITSLLQIMKVQKIQFGNKSVHIYQSAHRYKQRIWNILVFSIDIVFITLN